MSFPKTVLFVAIGAVLEIVGGFALAFGLPLLTLGFTFPADAEQLLSLPVVGALPLLKRREMAEGRRRLAITEYVAANPRSRFSESLRSLRFALSASNGGRMPLVIHVTSAVIGEGKSMLAAALAVSAANVGLRTALVDADLHRPSIAGLFNILGQPGLAEILVESGSVATVGRTYGKLPLTIIGAGAVDLVPFDIIGSARFKAIIQAIVEGNDLVILDSPPVLAVSDAPIISTLADVTLLVVEWQTTPKELVVQAAKALRTVGAPLAGIIFNKVEVAGAAAYGYGYGFDPRSKSVAAMRGNV